jgi:hypothetical protein
MLHLCCFFNYVQGLWRKECWNVGSKGNFRTVSASCNLCYTACTRRDCLMSLDDARFDNRIPAGPINFSPKGQYRCWGPHSLLFSGGKAAERVRLTTHFCILPNLRMSGVIHPLPLYVFMAWTAGSFVSEFGECFFSLRRMGLVWRNSFTKTMSARSSVHLIKYWGECYTHAVTHFHASEYRNTNYKSVLF